MFIHPPASYFIKFENSEDTTVIYARLDVVADLLIPINDQVFAVKIQLGYHDLNTIIFSEGVVNFKILEIDDIALEDKE